MKKRILALAAVTTLTSAAVANDALAIALGVGSFEGKPSIIAVFDKTLVKNNRSEITVEASKDNTDINIYQFLKEVPIRYSNTTNILSFGIESGYVNFKDYAAAGTIGFASTYNVLSLSNSDKDNKGIYLKTGFDFAFGGGGSTEKEVNSLYRATLALQYDNYIAGVSYRRVNLFNPNQDNRTNIFIGYSFVW